MVTIKKTTGETIIIGLDGERILKEALQCYIDHREVEPWKVQAHKLLQDLKG